MSLLQMQRETKTEKDQKPNQTGIPSYMKQDFEARSGLSYDDVRIHYSSPKPAELGALAYTQGSHVYIGPGQERHLPHELVHVAQQKRGEVRPTGKLGNVSVNDDPELERQADGGIVIQRVQAPFGPASQIVQRKIGMEYQTVGGRCNVYRHKQDGDLDAYKECGVTLFTATINGVPIEVTVDNGDVEYVTPAVDNPGEALKAGRAAAEIHKGLMNKKIPKKVDRGRVIFNGSRDEFFDGVYYYSFRHLGFTAHPQATVGIRMNKISALLTALGGGNTNVTVPPLGLTSGLLPLSEQTTQKNTMLNAPKNAKNALNAYLNSHRNSRVNDRDSIEGLLSLLLAYNDQFQIIRTHPKAALNAKNAMPVMNRTSLYDAYCTLDNNDRAIFLNVLQNELDQDSKRWQKVKIKKTDKPKAVDPGEEEITLAGQRVGPKIEDEYIWNTVSLEKWLQNLRWGVDALSTSPFSAIGGIENSNLKQPNKFGIASSTDIGLGTVPGMLLELRGLQRNVFYFEWGAIAQKVASLIDRLNRAVQPLPQLPNSNTRTVPQPIPKVLQNPRLLPFLYLAGK